LRRGVERDLAFPPAGADARVSIDAIHKAWMAQQATYQYVHGRPTAEWTAYEKYSGECWYTGASCRAAAVLALGGTLDQAHRMWLQSCGPTDMSGCDTGAVVRDHLTEAILIDIPVSFATAGIVKFVAEKAIFSAALDAGGTTVADGVLPKLKGTVAEAFAGGEYTEQTFHAGDLFYRSEAWDASRPGQWLGLESVDNAAEAEQAYNLDIWKNPKEVLRTYRLTEDVTMYYGRVAGADGYQALIPDNLSADSVLQLVSERPL
jgi:hypothetical protein